LGWQAAWFAEIEPFPSAVLAHHYPGVPNLGDMTRLPDLIRSGAVEVPDILCGGTPCQAFSVAGLRRSLDDERGNLSLTFCEIADAIDEHRPSIIFWENVPGVLNTKDNAFGCFLAGLAGEDEALVPPGGRWTNAGFVDGPARAVAWRVLDAQYFGLAQRRKRVFVVASARADIDPAAVLFEFEGVRRDTAPSREAGQRVANALTDRADRGGTNSEGQRLIPQPYAVANCLTARMHKGINTTLDEGQTPVLAIDGEFNSASHVSRPITTGAAHSNRGTMVAHAFDARQSDVIQYGDKSGPLDTDGHSVGVAIGTDCYNGQITGDVAATMGTPGSSVNASGPTVMQPVAPSLTASNDPSRSPQSAEVTQQVNAVYASSMQVRRLTPVECERLQGFPDGYTNIPWRGKSESPDGPRYKALGNSWAVPVVRWVGRRIASALA
jgi:DNA (cytosine-5)-methyltransferase 1